MNSNFFRVRTNHNFWILMDSDVSGRIGPDHAKLIITPAAGDIPPNPAVKNTRRNHDKG
jgi:hypothetical protein